MNFFKLYIGDYQRDTGSLSLAEHGAYMLMLQHHYATERPLPVGPSLHRMLRAQTRAERDAIDNVSARFWRQTVDGLVNDRAHAEIAKAATQADTNRRIAEQREAKKRATNGARIVQRTEHESCNESITDRSTIDQPSHSHSQKEQEQKKDQQLSASADADAPDRTDPIPIQAIIKAYNAAMVKLPEARVLTEKRRTAIRRAWQADPRFRSVDFWRAYFAECADDDFLNGTGPYTNGHENWRPTLDYLVKTETVAKVFERALDRAEHSA